MSRRRDRARRNRSVPTQLANTRKALVRRAAALAMNVEMLEARIVLSAAFDITQLTNMRADPTFSSINGAGIGIAVLDTGVFAANPDLAGNVKAFYDAVENPLGTPPDLNPIQDAFDHEGHGSHTSGIAASNNPAIGVAYGASLVDVRVFADPGENQLGGDPIDRGLQWVALHAAQFNIKVVNMSLGEPININFTPSPDQIGIDIQNLEAQGITVVSSSGNSYANDPVPGASIPAVESTISVANTWASNGVGVYDFSGYYGGAGDQWFAHESSAQPDTLAATSQRSTLFNQLAAPGQAIFSTWNSPAQLHNTISGTSMAAPFVSGTVALMQQAALQFGGRFLSPTEVLQVLRNSSDPIVDSNVTTNDRAEVTASGTLSTPEDLPETGDTFDRVNDYHAMQQVKGLVQGGAVTGTDINNTIATSIPLTPLNSITTDNATGNVGRDGTILVGNQDVDLYKITTTVVGNLSATVNQFAGGVSFNPVIRFFDASGNQLFSAVTGVGSPAVISSQLGSPLPVGTYYVGVSSQGNLNYTPPNGTNAVAGTAQGDYGLTVTLTIPDPHGVPPAADTLDLRSPNTLVPTAALGNVPAVLTVGTLGQETAPDGTVVLVPDGDVHFYSVVAPDTGELVIQADADVRVFDSNNNPVGTEGSNLVVPVTIGQTYYVGVTTQANAGFDPIDPFTRVPFSTPPTPFNLYVAFTNGDRNGTVAQATPEPIGVLTGDLGTDSGVALLGANGGNKDVDFYSYVVPAAGVFDARVGGNPPIMSLWTSTNGITGVQRLADSNFFNKELFEQVSAGEVVVVGVTGSGNQNYNGSGIGSGAGGQTGGYTLLTLLQPLSMLSTLSNNSIQGATPTPLTLAQTTTGNIGLDGTLVVGPNDVDVYSFTAPSTAEYQFATDTSQDGDAQTVLRVFDSSGNQVGANQSGSATSTNSIVKLPMSAGQTFYLGVSGVGPSAFTYNALNGSGRGIGSTGNYRLLASNVGAFQRTLTIQQGQKATYTDSNGHKVTVTLNGPGMGQLIFFSPSDGSDLGQLVLNGTDATSTLTVRGATSLPSVIVNGSLRNLNATQANVTGDMSISGSLRTLTLATAGGGHSISVGAGDTLNANIRTLTDESFVSAEPINTFRADQWTITSATRSQLSAPSVKSLNVRGTFDEDMAVDVIGNVHVGTLSGAAIRATNSIGSFIAGSALNSEIYAGVNSTLTTLPATAADFASQTGSIKTVTVRGAFSNTQIAAWNLGTLMLNNIQTNNNGTPFGIAGNNLKHLRAVPTGSKPQTQSNLFSPHDPIIIGGDAVVRMIG